MAAYAARAGIAALVLVPAVGISEAKVAQTLDYGATVAAIAGDFDRALEIVRTLDPRRFAIVNSVSSITSDRVSRAIRRHDPLHNLRDGIQVFEGIEREPLVAARHEALRATAILGRASTTAARTKGVGLRGFPAEVGPQCGPRGAKECSDRIRKRNARPYAGAGSPASRLAKRPIIPRTRNARHATQNHRGGCPPSPSRPGSRRATPAGCSCSAPATAATPWG